jgi:signal transduction histidine kinase
MTSGLLDLSRIEAGELPHEPRRVDLPQLLNEMSELYASRAEQAGIAFSLDVEEDAGVTQGDAEQLRHALGNLLDNAIKFTPEGGTVRASMKRVGQQIELWVEDSGIGIPADDLPHLFNRFHRGRNVSGYPGNGLGLAIVKAIVERHSGQVTAENTAQGARFTIRLPKL